MAWTDACKVEAVAQIEKRKEFSGGLRNAFRELSKESGIPYGTLRRWYYPESVPNNGNIPPESSIDKETCATSDLHTLMHDSGRKKIIFRLRETDGNWSLVMQEYRMERKGKEVATKNRLIMPLNLFFQFREAMDAIIVMIRKGCSTESGAGGSDPQENEEVDPPAGADRGDTQDIEHDGIGVETEPSPAPADGAEPTTVEAEFVQCVDCVHFAVKKWAPEENGACNSRSGSWNETVFQPPNEPHPCPNFQDGQPG